MRHAKDVPVVVRDNGRTMPQRLDTLTGMRFLAAAAVVLYHLDYFRNDSALDLAWLGRSGVGFFFILSGFVLAWSARPGDTARAFWWRRGARVLPLHVLLWVVFAAVMLSYGDSVSAATFVIGGSLQHVWIPTTEYSYRVNVPAWSIGAELFFYALFPALLLFARRITSVRALLVWAAGCLVLFAAIGAAFAMTLEGDRLEWATWINPAYRILEFATGICLALAVRAGWRPRIAMTFLLGWIIAVAAVGTLTHNEQLWTDDGLAHLLVTPALAAAVVAGAMRDVSGRGSWLSRPTLVRLGAWSFAMYLVHWPVLSVIQYAGIEWSAAVSIGAVLAIVALSAALHTTWERPVERRLRSMRPGRATAIGGGRVPGEHDPGDQLTQAGSHRLPLP